MFTKEKLEKWIDTLEEYIGMDERRLEQFKDRKPIYEGIFERKSNTEDLKHTLEKLYTTITKED